MLILLLFIIVSIIYFTIENQKINKKLKDFDNEGFKNNESDGGIISPTKTSIDDFSAISSLSEDETLQLHKRNTNTKNIGNKISNRINKKSKGILNTN